MKKALKIIVILSITSLVGYWGYTWYCNTASLLGVIHKDADSVIKIGIQDIKETLVLDAITSPKYYYNNASFKTKKKEKDTVEKKGINFTPHNLVLFTVPKVQNTYFSILTIEDNNAFKNQIKEYSKGLHQKIDKEHNIHWLEHKKQHWVCAWSNNKLVVSFGLDNTYQKSKKVFVEVLKEGKVITSKNNKWITTLSKSNSHITFIDTKGKTEIQFKDGKAVLEGSLETNEVNAYPNKVSYDRVPNAALEFYWDGNFNRNKNREQFIASWKNNAFLKKANINVPEIAELTNGFFYAGVNGTTMQTDTIITYGYDDNFNKIEQKSLQEKLVPSIILNLGREKQPLKSYLKEQELLTENNIFKSIPFYHFYVEEDATATCFKTQKLKQSTEQITSSNFMNLFVDFNKAKEVVQIPQVNRFFNLLNSLQISAQQSSNNKVVLKGTIEGKLEKVNILSQVFFGVRQE
ncbi:hypothetical protein CLV91_0954 [Maribacter vaceletii]|uniref:Uncharacterized protein n=1 Tax=Maribacter vaceletii TaxID=1206816 RepID=A0A495EE88_9FLAO|nr:hypothetical protein [Maribacter vaceletii]RKR14873.1 hypothetical protein CLV91_0954 [Maribacter vaceletii]